MEGGKLRVPKRKVVQLEAVPLRTESEFLYHLFLLCDDGTVWWTEWGENWMQENIDKVIYGEVHDEKKQV